MPPSTTPGRPAVAVAAALAVLLLGLLPVVNWLPGGHEVTWYPRVAEGWLWGTTLALGIGRE